MSPTVFYRTTFHFGPSCHSHRLLPRTSGVGRWFKPGQLVFTLIFTGCSSARHQRCTHYHRHFAFTGSCCTPPPPLGTLPSPAAIQRSCNAFSKAGPLTILLKKIRHQFMTHEMASPTRCDAEQISKLLLECESVLSSNSLVLLL